MKKEHFIHVGWGFLGGFLIFAFYFGFLLWGQGGISGAWFQFLKDWYFILPITFGFGLQVGLFSCLRWLVKERKTGGAASVGVSTATSTTSMVACCVHRILDVLPVLGFSGALIFLVNFRTYFLILALLSNLFGIIFIFYKIYRFKKLAL